VIVLIHPNNPGGDRFERAQLLELHSTLAHKGGWLVVDEAFMDATPEDSLCDATDRDGLIVLRSVGKFFGLAGARAGFACATPALLATLGDLLGPWTIAGPSRHVLHGALADRDWHAMQRDRLSACSTRLGEALQVAGFAADAGCAFFQWKRDVRARALHDALARRAILMRLFETPSSLRFGLPRDDAAFDRLHEALVSAMPEIDA
jgi:cobalamin biosynthesis protein CobC